MKHQIFFLTGLLLLTSCKSQTISNLQIYKSTGAQTNMVLKSQESIAKEIVSIEYSFGDAMLRLNNTNAVNFAAEMDSLSDHLDKISKELDALGTFRPELRETTLKKLDDVEKALFQRLQIKIESVSQQPEVGEIIAPAVARCLSARLSVKDKAGLLIETPGASSGINTKGQGQK